jgi:hypothetical protein
VLLKLEFKIRKEQTMRFSELIESKINGITVQSLKQFLINSKDDEDDDLELEEAKGDFGLGAKYRNPSHKEMMDYLNRKVFPSTDAHGKSQANKDKLTMPYIHPSTAKNIMIKDEDGVSYDLDALKKQIMKRPSTLLKQNEKMKHSNGKATVYYNVGLPALRGLAVNEETGEFVIVDTCPGAGVCKTFCYAMKGGYIQYPATSMKQTQTINFLMNDPDGFSDVLKNEIQHANNKWNKFSSDEYNKGDVNVSIRWHDAGDFFSPEYMELAYDVARSFPDNIFYAYTKMASVANAKKPDNFIINFSAGALPSEGKQVDLTQIKHSEVVPKDMFFDLIARKGNTIIKDESGATQFKNEDAINQFKFRLSEKYNIKPETILTYNEFIEKMANKDLGDKQYWNVIVMPGNGDVSAANPTVLGTYLLFH